MLVGGATWACLWSHHVISTCLLLCHVQLTEMLADASGIAELEDFRCFMFGDANARVDLVQSFEVRHSPLLLDLSVPTCLCPHL